MSQGRFCGQRGGWPESGCVVVDRGVELRAPLLDLPEQFIDFRIRALFECSPESRRHALPGLAKNSLMHPLRPVWLLSRREFFLWRCSSGTQHCDRRRGDQRRQDVRA